jgi:hypothetical protein
MIKVAKGNQLFLALLIEIFPIFSFIDDSKFRNENAPKIVGIKGEAKPLNYN